MKHLIPYPFDVEVDGKIIDTIDVCLEYKQKEIDEIVRFILDNQYFDCELCNMPGHCYDEVIGAMNETLGEYLAEYTIKGDDIRFYDYPFFPPEMIKAFPEELRAKLNTEGILESYNVKTMDELLALCQEEEPAPAKKKYEEGTFMKTLAIQQPYASLIALGIKDIECRDNMKASCRKIFIAASLNRKSWDELPDFVQKVVLDLEKAGIMPPYKEWPTKCIVGHADIVKVTYDDVESIWGRYWDGIKYVLSNAKVLDEPLYGLNKATPYFYNVEGYNENNLPASHKVDLSGIELPE